MGWPPHVHPQSLVIPTSARTHNPRDYKSQALGKGFRWLRLVFMVLNDWIQLFAAAQYSARCSQFGRLAYWQMARHPSSNQYVLFYPFKCLLEYRDTEPLSSQAAVAIVQSPLSHYTHLPALHLFPSLPGRTLWSSVQSGTLPRSQSAMRYAPPPSSRAAKLSNQTTHPSLSCGVE